MSDAQATPAAVPTGWTVDDIARLKQSIATSGNVQSVTYDDGKQVRYLPTTEALTLLARMEHDVRAAVAVAVSPLLLDPLHRPRRRFVAYMRAPY